MLLRMTWRWIFKYSQYFNSRIRWSAETKISDPLYLLRNGDDDDFDDDYELVHL